MAVFIPTMETILQFRVKLEPGELVLLQFLEKTLDDSFEIYFNPYMNGDRPDVIIMRKGYGVLIIEVKDWKLDNYRLDERKHWVLRTNEAVVKSPIDQVLKYKDNLFELHIESLLEMKIKDIRQFNMVACAIYFHNASNVQIDDLLVKPFIKEEKYQKFLRYNINFIGQDNLNESDFKKLLKKRYLIAERQSFLFTLDIYDSFRRLLNPPMHMKMEGVSLKYSMKQNEIIYERNKKQQRIKGVVGSGKTTILAARAVQAYKRAEKLNPQARVLILTYNITLKNFIHDKLQQVDEDFPWSAFIISNYHSFINSELNNLGIIFDLSEECDKHDVSEYLDKHYYSNKKLFMDCKDKIERYDVILIDEIQDYKRAWMDIIKDYFLAENGEYVLFGDVKQNIYHNEIEQKDVKTNVSSRPVELKRCFRSEFKVRDLAIEYQKNIFRDKYEIDSFNENEVELTLDFEQQGYINYMYLQDTNVVSTLYTIIHENIINKNFTISPNDITILGYTTSLLQKFEAFYRYSSNERTTTMFETYEIMYMQKLKYLVEKEHPEWLMQMMTLIKKDKFKKNAEAVNQIARLFTVYDLYLQYSGRFDDKLSFYCLKYKCTLDAFIALVKKFENEITSFRTSIYDYNYKIIRDNKKLHFWMNSGTIKISTIHSFKGWESEVVFLILEKKEDYSTSFDELLYTGITRCRSNLIVINLGNEEYLNKIKPLIHKVK